LDFQAFRPNFRV